MLGKSRLKDRKEAGEFLAARIPSSLLEKESFLILALPRGGVPVAYEIAKKLNLPMDILVVRKIGHPLYAEYGIGATTEGGYHFLDPQVGGLQLSYPEAIGAIIEREKQEVIRRVKKYRNNRPLDLKGKSIILVDDGLATGVTATVAVRYLQDQGVKRIILALPVCALETAQKLREMVDRVICLKEIVHFAAVGDHYEDFQQTTDEEVMEIISKMNKRSSDQDYTQRP